MNACKGGRRRPPSFALAGENIAHFDDVRAHPQNVEAHGRQMRRHDPTGLLAIGDDERLDAQGGAQLLDRLDPDRRQAALGNHVFEIGTGCRQDAVIAIELTVGEPEAVVGARVEPAAIVVFRTLAKDRRGVADGLKERDDADSLAIAAWIREELKP